MKVKISRSILMKLICCTLLVVVGVAAPAQGPGPRSGTFPPTSGAMLEIQGTVGSTSIDLKLYDSQIHSGSVMPVPLGNASTNTSNCNGNDQIPTDAYVLQGGAPNGCDPGDPYEVTENNAGTHQASGLKSETKFSGFHIDTHYLSEPIVSITAASQSDTTTTYTYSVTRGADLVSGETIVVSGYTGTDVGNNGTFPSISVGSGTFSVTNASGVNSGQSATGTVSNAVCNTSGTICAAPDSGFLTVTNNTGSVFSGTISLTGNSPIAGDPFCPAALVAGGPGVASDTFTGNLSTSGAGQSVRLGLGSQGAIGSPKAADSSNCGGFNQAQPLTLTPNVTSTAFFGGGPPAGGVCAPPCKNDYQFTPLNSASGDTLSVLPVPVPAGPLGSGTFGPFPPGCVGSGCTFQSGAFGSESPIDASPLRFSATNFSSVTSITQASLSGSNTTYTYTLTSGAALRTGEAITITGMTNAGNNGTFTITGLGTGMFTVSNASGVTTTTAQSGTGTVNIACVPYADFTANGNPVCVELQLTPSEGDGGNYFYTATNNFNIDGFSLPNGIGGPALAPRCPLPGQRI